MKSSVLAIFFSKAAGSRLPNRSTQVFREIPQKEALSFVAV